MKFFLFFLLLCLIPLHAQAFSWKALWMNKNQRALQYYREQRYDKAAALFATKHAATDYYNLGNALALQHLDDKAIHAYETALTLDPQLKDAAFNRDLLKNKKRQEEQSQNQSQEKKQTTSTTGTPEPSSQQQKQSSQNNTASNSDKQKTQEEQSPETPSNTASTENSEERTLQQTSQEEMAMQQRQADEQWLQQIPDSPPGLLEQKFLRDHARYEKNKSSSSGESS